MQKTTKAAISAATKRLADYWEAIRSPRLTEGRNEVEFRIRTWLEDQVARGVSVAHAEAHANSGLTDTPTRAHLYSRELVERWGEAPAKREDPQTDRLEEEAQALKAREEGEAASVYRALEQMPADPLTAGEDVKVRAREAWEREVNSWSPATRRRVLEHLTPAQRTFVMRRAQRRTGV